MLNKNTQRGCLDYQKLGKDKITVVETINNVLPLFYVDKVIYSIENPNSTPIWRVYVDQRGTRQYRFTMSSDCIASDKMLKVMTNNGILCPRWLEYPVESHLLYGNDKCEENGQIGYINKVLGWYPFDNYLYYFLDRTDLLNRMYVRVY